MLEMLQVPEQRFPCRQSTEGSHSGAGEECEVEGEAQRSCYGLTRTSIPTHTSGEEVKDSRVKECLRRRKEEKVFQFYHHPTLF